MTIPALERWYDYVKTKDRAVLWDALHPDTVFESPVVHTPQHGREITFKYLSSAVKVLGRPGFSFVGEWRSETGAVVEFEGEIDGIRINGVDMITVGDDGRITHFKVMVRPLKAQPAASPDGGATGISSWNSRLDFKMKRAPAPK
jgi:hypothetical protein